MQHQHPIPNLPQPDWEAVTSIAIDENDEPLVPVGLVPERILSHPAYHLDGTPGAIAECYVREGVLERLLEAAELLPENLRLVVLDGWRPHEVQQYLYEQLQAVLRERRPDMPADELSRRTREFVAPPSMDPVAPSPHLTGGAVDVTLCDHRGRLLPMGSEFDEITERSHTAYYEADGRSEQVRYNRRLLYQVMTAAGFSNLASEWWHFDYGNQSWAWNRGEKAAHYGLGSMEPLSARWRRQLMSIDGA